MNRRTARRANRRLWTQDWRRRERDIRRRRERIIGDVVVGSEGVGGHQVTGG
jgi:hypothetical protein